MNTLNIYLFGEPRVCLGSQPPLRFPTQKTLELVVIAALSVGDQITRERMATALRDDMPDAQSRRALSTDLWRLRQLFSDSGVDSADYLHADRRTLGFRNDAAIFLDVAAFERATDKALRTGPDAMHKADAAAVADALSLYRDDFLVSLDREWCLILRENLRAKYTACLDLLLSFEMKSDAWQRALHWAERLIAADPLLEHGHRAVMQCQFLLGNRGVAIRQYTKCAALLRRELGVEPAPETQRMYRGLLSVRIPSLVKDGRFAAAESALPASPSGPTSDRDSPRHLTDQLSMALGNLNTAQKLIENVDRKLRRGGSN